MDSCSIFPFQGPFTFTIVLTLEKLHSRHVLPGFADRSQEEREIEVITTEITRVSLLPIMFRFETLFFDLEPITISQKRKIKDFRICQSLVQKVTGPVHVFPPNPKSSHHETLAGKNVQRGLAAKIQDLSATFRKKQRVYMESA